MIDHTPHIGKIKLFAVFICLLALFAVNGVADYSSSDSSIFAAHSFPAKSYTGAALALPTISSINPSTATIGATINATVSGTGLSNTLSVVFSGRGVIATIKGGGTDTSLPLSIFIAPDASAGPRTFTVTTAEGSVTSGNITLTLVAPTAKVDSLNPDRLFAGGPASDIRIIGSGFIASSVVKVNGIKRTTEFVRSTQLKVRLSAEEIKTSGTFSFSVENPPPGGESNIRELQIISTGCGGTLNAINLKRDSAPPCGSIITISPSNARQGDTLNAVISVFGFFAVVTDVDFGQKITATIQPGATAFTIPVQIKIDEKADIGKRSIIINGFNELQDAFEVLPQITTVSSISPATAAQGSTVDAVITGTGLQKVTAVNFNVSAVTANLLPGATSTSLPVRIVLAADAATGPLPFTLQTANEPVSSGNVTFEVTLARAATISIISRDPVVNRGQGLQLQAEVLDSTGNIISNAAIRFESDNTEVASVDPTNVIRGNKAGVTTITARAQVSSQLVTDSVSLQVTEIEDNDLGDAGIGEIVIVTDESSPLRTFILRSDFRRHVIRQDNLFGGSSSVFAGTEDTAGGEKDPTERLNSHFNRPHGISFDRLTGDLYVADSENSVIRKITKNGSVEVVTGALGQSGDQNGTLAQARFNKPRGIASDSRNRKLYVADTGNHTIRVIDLNTQTVSTIAGKSGDPGLSDGPGAQARLRSPRGLIIDAVGFNVIVADNGNNRVRLVSPDGNVLTFGVVGGQSIKPINETQEAAIGSGVGITFDGPSAVSIDGASNIYVAERNGVKRIAKLGSTVTDLVQKATFVEPTGLAASGNSVFVYDVSNSQTGRSLLNKVVVPASITAITPSSGNVGSTVDAVITGSNLEGAIAVDFTGSGVTARILQGGTSTSLPVRITIAADAALGARSFTVTTADSKASSPADAVFTIKRVNRPPVLSPINDQNVSLGSTITITPSATDADNDRLIYSVTGLPPTATINALTGAITYKGVLADAGKVFNVVLTASDEFGGADSKSFKITVSIKPGDVNGNGEVDSNDLVLLIQVLLGNRPLSDAPGADVNGDKRIDVADLIRLILILNGRF